MVTEARGTAGRRIYAIGDIHGRRDLLDLMLERIRADLADRPHPRSQLVFLGDYVDRGPDSRGVVERLLAIEREGIAASFLLGNHDACLLGYLQDPAWSSGRVHWFHAAMGGAATLASYGVANAHEDDPEAAHAAFIRAFPDDHRAFFERCALMLPVGGYLFVHAGIRPGIAIEAQTEEDLLWIRAPFLEWQGSFGVKVVHGHTIVPSVEHHPNRIAVDTGAVKSGLLSCVVLEDEAVSLLTTAGPRPLPPRSGGLAGAIAGGLKRIWRR